MKTYTYIVVEDEDLIRSNIVKKIEQGKLPLQLNGEAYDGSEAMRIIEDSPPDIVVTDIRMPVMDGLELCGELYFAYPRISKIIVTGYNDFEYAQKAIRYGAEDFILKPVSREELLASLQRIIVKLDARHLEDASLRIQADAGQKETEEIAGMVELYIRENFRNQISLGDVAEKLGYTADHLSKLFKKFRNESPSKFLSRIRINEAKYLLTSYPTYEIREIGERVGYAEPSYFSRVFKNQTGMYPSEYRSQK